MNSPVIYIEIDSSVIDLLQELSNPILDLLGDLIKHDRIVVLYRGQFIDEFKYAATIEEINDYFFFSGKWIRSNEDPNIYARQLKDALHNQFFFYVLPSDSPPHWSQVYDKDDCVWNLIKRPVFICKEVPGIPLKSNSQIDWEAVHLKLKQFNLLPKDVVFC